jgi:uncharacterized iron-regulated protein
MDAGVRRLAWLLLAPTLLLATHSATAQELPAPPVERASPRGPGHALAGTIWSAQRKRPVSRDELADALATTPIVLLGEVHDNADHHFLRAWVIGALAGRNGQGAKAEAGPAIVFEHIRADQQPMVDSYLSSSTQHSAEGLLQTLEWEQSGWPAGQVFAPLFEEALRFRLPILGGNTPRETIRSVGRQGLSALPAEERTRLRMDAQLAGPLHQALIAEIAASHCGVLPEAAFSPMAIAQQYRDAHLADVLLNAQRDHGSSVLIAGNGHVRSDRGVPWHLRQRAPTLNTIEVAFVEVETGKADVEDYLPRDPAGVPAVDFVWFTTQPQRPDPCEAMRRRFKDTNGKSLEPREAGERGSRE